jgi:hypothetical protein
MTADTEETRRQAIQLLEVTRRATKALLSPLDPEREIHADERAWRVRDILGHLGVWNWEAARSLQAYAGAVSTTAYRAKAATTTTTALLPTSAGVGPWIRSGRSTIQHTMRCAPRWKHFLSNTGVAICCIRGTCAAHPRISSGS